MLKKQQDTLRKTQSDLLKEVVVHGMQEKKAVSITVLDLRHVNHAVADFFVICTGNSETQISAIVDSIEEQVYKQLGESPFKKDQGVTGKGWLLLDYFDVVAHVFQKDKRDFYALEELWGDAQIMQIH